MTASRATPALFSLDSAIASFSLVTVADRPLKSEGDKATIADFADPWLLAKLAREFDGC